MARDADVDLRPALAASILMASTSVHHRRVLRARDLIYRVLLDYFVDDAGHHGAMAHANNVAAGLDGCEPGEFAEAAVLSLSQKGLRGEVLRKAASRVVVAWQLGMKGEA